MSKKIFIHKPDFGSCAYYRALLPFSFCREQLAGEGIELFLSERLNAGDHYDGYLFHRVIQPHFLGFLSRGEGRLGWENDDDLWNIPAWNPAAQAVRQPQLTTVRAVMDRADVIAVSTEPLARVTGLPDKTLVCPNLVDLEAYPPATPRQDNYKVHILWTGSAHHERELLEIVPAVEKIIARHGDKVQFYFFGDLPVPFTDWARITGTNLAVMVPHDRYQGRVGYIPPVEHEQYSPHLEEINADIALCPLTGEKFNDSKSNIKWMETTLTGSAVVATDMPPYQCIESGVHGLLVKPGDTEGWYEALDALIRYPEERQRLQANARRKIEAEYSWQYGAGRGAWQSLFRRLA